MTFRTLGEAVLAAHRAEQADDDAARAVSVPNANCRVTCRRALRTGRAAHSAHSDGDGCCSLSDVLSPTWIILYFISQRPRGGLPQGPP